MASPGIETFLANLEKSNLLSAEAMQQVRAEAERRRPGRGLERCRGGRVIAMGVRDKDMGDRLALKRGAQRGEMCRIVGSGIDHRNLTFADNGNAGALEGERARVPRQETADQRAGANRLLIETIE